MTQLQLAKSRSTARTETHVAFRGAVSNPEWEGLAVTIGDGDGNGGTWGAVEQPQSYFATTMAIGGSATSVSLNGADLTNFATWAGGVFFGGSLRVYRAVSGNIELIRTATVTGAAVDYWSRVGSENIITGNTFEFRFDSWTARIHVRGCPNSCKRGHRPGLNRHRRRDWRRLYGSHTGHPDHWRIALNE